MSFYLQIPQTSVCSLKGKEDFYCREEFWFVCSLWFLSCDLFFYYFSSGCKVETTEKCTRNSILEELV